MDTNGTKGSSHKGASIWWCIQCFSLWKITKLSQHGGLECGIPDSYFSLLEEAWFSELLWTDNRLLESAQWLLVSSTILALNIHFCSSCSEKTLTQKSNQASCNAQGMSSTESWRQESKEQIRWSTRTKCVPCSFNEASDHLRNLTQAFTRPKYMRCECLFYSQVLLLETNIPLQGLGLIPTLREQSMRKCWACFCYPSRQNKQVSTVKVGSKLDG